MQLSGGRAECSLVDGATDKIQARLITEICANLRPRVSQKFSRSIDHISCLNTRRKGATHQEEWFDS